MLYFLLRQYLAALGSIYLIILGALAMITMMVAPKGIWGFFVSRFGLSLFPVGYHVMLPGRRDSLDKNDRVEPDRRQLDLTAAHGRFRATHSGPTQGSFEANDRVKDSSA